MTLIDWKEPEAGDLRIGDAKEYGREGGYCIEQLGYVGGEYSWCVPGWVEDRFGETGFFNTKDEALDFYEMVKA